MSFSSFWEYICIKVSKTIKGYTVIMRQVELHKEKEKANVLYISYSL
jgi:hypothetical protein